MLKHTILILGILMLIVGVSVFGPVPIVTEDEALVVTGVVESVHEGTSFDVVIRLVDQSRRYYINRGLERGLSMHDLEDKLVGKEAILKYPKYWTPLDWNGSTVHISKVEVGDEVIFNELKV